MQNHNYWELVRTSSSSKMQDLFRVHIFCWVCWCMITRHYYWIELHFLLLVPLNLEHLVNFFLALGMTKCLHAAEFICCCLPDSWHIRPVLYMWTDKNTTHCYQLSHPAIMLFSELSNNAKSRWGRIKPTPHVTDRPDIRWCRPPA